VKTWFDGRTQWSYVASNDEVNITEPTAEELQSLNPYAWLYMYKQGYKLKMGKNNAAGKSAYEVVMNAADPHQDLQCIILYVAKDTYRPLKISMAQRGGKNATLIVVNDFQTGQSYPDRFFTFDKKAYPSAEEIDLR
jgi:outer membrane lipoprotein-sorting protein